MVARHLASLLPVVVVLLGGAVAAPRSLLSNPGGPSEAGLYLAPVHYNHTLDGPAFSAPSQLYHSVARAPHHVAPISSLARAGRSGDDAPVAVAGNRLIVVGGGAAPSAAEGKDGDDAPWDAQGRPRRR